MPREFVRAADLLSSPTLLNVGVGRHVRMSLAKDWTVQYGEDCWNEEFAFFIAAFFNRCSPLVRILKMG